MGPAEIFVALSLTSMTFINAFAFRAMKKILLEFVLKVRFKIVLQTLTWLLELELVLVMLGFTEIIKETVFQFAKQIKFLTALGASASKVITK